jgi:hypothetical protein
MSWRSNQGNYNDDRIMSITCPILVGCRIGADCLQSVVYSRNHELEGISLGTGTWGWGFGRGVSGVMFEFEYSGLPPHNICIHSASKPRSR